MGAESFPQPQIPDIPPSVVEIGDQRRNPELRREISTLEIGAEKLVGFLPGAQNPERFMKSPDWAQMRDETVERFDRETIEPLLAGKTVAEAQAFFDRVEPVIRNPLVKELVSAAREKRFVEFQSK